MRILATAAVYGTVTGADSTAVEQATVSVTNTANGERWQTATQAGASLRPVWLGPKRQSTR